MCTELALAFGLLGSEPLHTEYQDVASKFGGTVSEEIFDNVRDLLRKDQRLRGLSALLWELGSEMRIARPDLFSDTSVRWSGPVKQARSVTTAQDLVAGTTAVSVKANSRVVYNLSPFNLFVNLPKGLELASKGPNWFSTKAKAEQQALFALVGPKLGFDSVEGYYTSATPAEKRKMKGIIRDLSALERSRFTKAYRRMCLRTAELSAAEFNVYLARSMSGPHAEGVKSRILRHFFRLGDSPYILAGLEHMKPFALLVPSLTDWRREYQVVSLTANAVTAGQSKVSFRIKIRGRQGQELTMPFHAEIRWSHGPFCGHPEGKLYRDFEWPEAPGFEKIV